MLAVDTFRRVRGSWWASAVLVCELAAVGAVGAQAAVAPAVTAEAVRAHESGIWSLAPAGGLRRWVVIHGLREGGDVLHLEVLGRPSGAPSWQVQHLVDHMAVSLPALLRSVERPLERGAVYPESFDQALRRWQAERDAGAGAVCATTIDRCLAGEWQ
jgi:hypothetical protein